ncbi:hypothetical protein B0H17DRAFT_1139556 [Mycena rosella]|uniref:Uncharacterized protein n=1 Tax=Mycena rosella TaxID=1033263 RepID=A0AAD7GB10_MYCRO|nr:hypothetical protein B0H17DRAFT_1139556 [Mycena rosella]
MLPFHRLYRAIISYRLGYSPQRPYPGRWTTPVVLGAFILLAAALAAINESTFRPNDTIPPLPFSSLIPEILRHPTGGFSPQILTVGDAIQLNNSIFNFTMTAAFNELDNTQPDEFSPAVYLRSNEPLDEHERGSSSNRFDGETAGRILGPLDMNKPDPQIAVTRMAWLFPGYNGTSITAFAVTVEPCCNCAAEPSQVAEASMDQDGATLLPTHPPCSSLPARFVVTGGEIGWNSSGKGGGGLLDVNNTDIFSGPLCGPTRPECTLNTFQSLYHLVRMEFGVILENQIYASPDMYNKSISQGIAADSWTSAAINSRLSTTNATLMAEWRDSVRFFNETDRVPVMPYLRSVPRLKPLGSAITSVFVSTFAMLSVAWTIFSLIAGAVAASHADKPVCEEDETTIHPEPYMRRDLEGQQRSMQEWDTSEARLFVSEDKRVTLMETMIQRLGTVEKNSVARSEMQLALAEIQLSLARMRLSLRTHGVLEEVDEGLRNINEVERERRGAVHILHSE